MSIEPAASPPDCPACGHSMVRAFTPGDSNGGRGFWRCPEWPRCDGLIDPSAAHPRPPDLEARQLKGSRSLLNRIKPSPATPNERLAEIQSRSPMAYERWTPAEEAQLLALAEQGTSIADIAARLKRQPSAIQSRLTKLDERPSASPSKPRVPQPSVPPVEETPDLGRAEGPVAADRSYYRLSQITRRIGKLLAPAVQSEFWLRAEIGSGTERNGAFYGELIETDREGKQIARLSCRIWRDDLTTIKRRFADAGLDVDLGAGTAIGARCAVQYDGRYGLSLRIVEMDPAFAIGELELRRRMIIDRLTREHLLGANRLRPIGLLPMRIGVVASRTSAGFADFMKTLTMSGFAFKIFVADALMQGPQTQFQVQRALDVCAGLQVDLIALIRGGGSKTDLASLDNELIARRIAGSPIAVWTGIGHETDSSVLDFVAAQAHKTPSALAEALVQRLKTVEEHSHRADRQIRAVWGLRFGIEIGNVRRSRVGLSQGTRKLIEITQEQLEGQKSRVAGRVQLRITSAKAVLSRHRTSLEGGALGAINSRRRSTTAIRSRLRAAGQLGIQKRGEPLRIRRLQLRPERLAHLIQQHRADTSEARRALRHMFESRLAEARRTTIRSRGELSRTSRRVEAERRVLQRAEARVQASVVLNRIQGARVVLRAKEQAVRASTPATMLARGFSLTYRSDGSLIRSAADVRTGDTLRTEVSDGVIVSKVAEASSNE